MFRKKAAKDLIKHAKHFETLLWGLQNLAGLKSVAPLLVKFQEWLSATYGENDWKQVTLSLISAVRMNDELRRHH